MDCCVCLYNILHGYSYPLAHKELYRMFADDCQTWQYGPVYPKVCDKFSDLEIDGSIYLDEIKIDALDLEEYEILYSHFGN